MQVLEHVKIGLINSRLEINADLDNPLDLVRQDIYLRAKLEVVEDLLGYDAVQTELARERQKKQPRPE